MNKRLYKALCIIEDTIATLIATACLVVFFAETIEGSTMHYIAVKLVALAIFTAIICFEGK